MKKETAWLAAEAAERRWRKRPYRKEKGWETANGGEE